LYDSQSAFLEKGALWDAEILDNLQGCCQANAGKPFFCLNSGLCIAYPVKKASMFQQKNNIMAYSRFLSPNMWGCSFLSIPNLGTGFPCQGYELKKE
jgi:hypothetical protein